MLDAQIDEPFAPEVDLEQLRRVIERVLGAEGLRGEVEVSLLVVDDATIRQLNATHRAVDRVTDVLSFPLQAPEELAAGEPTFVGPPDNVLRLGDVVVSFPRAKEQAADYGHSLARELAYLTVHGVLHLLGYDHEDEADRRVMRAKEEAALQDEQGLARAGD
jgi:probable rRNA maturation factor